MEKLIQGRPESEAVMDEEEDEDESDAVDGLETVMEGLLTSRSPMLMEEDMGRDTAEISAAVVSTGMVKISSSSSSGRLEIIRSSGEEPESRSVTRVREGGLQLLPRHW